MNFSEKAMQYALHRAHSLLKKDAALPGYVFDSSWRLFYFFASDRMFEEDFVNLVKKLLTAEGASTCCVINISLLDSKEEEAKIFIEIGHGTSPQQYLDSLKDDDSASAWLYGVDTFLASSEKERWCIYCERENDVGVVALDIANTDCQRAVVDFLRAIPSNELYENVADQVFPFSHLTAFWREKLSNTY